MKRTTHPKRTRESIILSIWLITASLGLNALFFYLGSLYDDFIVVFIISLGLTIAIIVHALRNSLERLWIALTGDWRIL